LLRPPPLASRFSGALGSGLAIFSRFPIISTHTLPYALSGLPLHVIAGDFFVNKAAGSCVLLHPELGEVEVWSTHVSAHSPQYEASVGSGGIDTYDLDLDACCE